MNSGKSTALLQVAYNYEERGMRVLIIKPRVDLKADNKVLSRLGVTREVDDLIMPRQDIREIVRLRMREGKLACILVDEVQFLEPKQIDELFEVSVKCDIPVICYGLRTDFKMQGFPASERLLLIAHEIEELKTICRCGKKAILNGRKLGGKFVFEGSQIAIDEMGDVSYESLCGSCYFKMQEEKTLSACLKDAVSALQTLSSTPALDAKMIVKHVLDCNDADLITKQDMSIEREDLARIEELVQRRCKKEPVAYLIGKKGFLDFEFAVGEGVLIPRPDTELLVQTVAERIGDSERLGLEIGLGSACISVSLLKLCQGLRMRASEVSEEALAYAEQNIAALEVGDRIDAFLADLIDDTRGRYDFIVSNPPYIDEEEYARLMPDVKDYEPKRALHGGKDGLDYYRKILNLADEILKRDGFVAFEIGYDQAASLRSLLAEHSYDRVEVFQDLAGKDRVVIGVKHDK